MNDAELLKLREGMNKHGYKIKICPLTGLIRVFKRDDKFDEGYDPTVINYLFVDSEYFKYIREHKLFKDCHTCETPGEFKFGPCPATIDYKNIKCRSGSIFTMFGKARPYRNEYSYYSDIQPQYVVDNYIISNPDYLWHFPNGLFQFQPKGDKYALVEIDKARDLIPTKLNIGDGLIMPITVSDLIGMLALTIGPQIYFIKKEKLVSYTQYMINCKDNNSYWFIGEYNTNLYNVNTGEKFGNADEFFEPHEVVKKVCGTVFVENNIRYPNSKYYIHLYKVKTESGSSLYFADGEDGAIDYIPPLSSGKFTKPALRDTVFF